MNRAPSTVVSPSTVVPPSTVVSRCGAPFLLMLAALSSAFPAPLRAQSQVDQKGTLEGEVERDLASAPDVAWELGPTLEPSPSEPFDLIFPFSVPVQEVFEQIAVSTGLEIVPDGNFRMGTVAAELEGVTAEQALSALAIENGWFFKVLGSRRVLVAADTPQNRRQHESLYLHTFRLEHAIATDVASQLRSLLDVRKVAIDAAANTVSIRDSAAILLITRRLLERLDRPLPRVDVLAELLVVAAASEGRRAEAPPTCGSLTRDGILSGQALAKLREDRQTQVLLAPRLGIAGSGKALFSTVDSEVHDPSTPSGPRFQLSVAALVHHRGKETTLDIRLAFAQLAPLFSLAGNWPADTQTLASTLLVNDGESSVIGPLLCRQDGSGELILVLTPKVFAPPQLPEEQLSPLHIGTNAALGLLPGFIY